MKQNYCEIKKNKIYADIYDELLDEELSMNNSEHNNKIKTWITKKILKLNYIELSDCFESIDDIIADIIIKITQITLSVIILTGMSRNWRTLLPA